MPTPRSDDYWRDDVIAALWRIETKTDALIKNDDDKEKRLRSLEKWRWLHTVPLAAVAALAAKLGLPIGSH